MLVENLIFESIVKFKWKKGEFEEKGLPESIRKEVNKEDDMLENQNTARKKVT
jgi:hypothetical protein